MDEVYRFLEAKHKDHYKVYNLCSERQYDPSKFHQRVTQSVYQSVSQAVSQQTDWHNTVKVTVFCLFTVATYPFDDHNAPPFELIKPFCDDVDEWLKADKQNVAIVHCKAGKCFPYIIIVTCIIVILGPYFTLWQYKVKIHQSPVRESSKRGDTSINLQLAQPLPICGDIKVEFIHKTFSKERMFQFWFNTFFISVGANLDSEESSDPTLQSYSDESCDSDVRWITIPKSFIDKAHKDEKCRVFQPDFKCAKALWKEGAKALGKEGAKALGKEGAKALGKEGAKALGKEGAKALWKEGAKALGKEGAKALWKEGAKALGKEGAKALGKEGAKALWKEGAKALGKEGAKALGKEGAKALGKEGAKALGKEGAKALGKEGAKALGPSAFAKEGEK
ncbi:hypothetical protein QZH41_017979, partial [Actinostola sp. cb2023]